MDFPMSRQISQRQQLEQLEHDLFLYRMMVNASLDSITLIDRNYIYRIVNQAYINARQLKREEIVNHSVAEVWGREIFEHVIKKQLDDCFSGKTVSHASAYEFRSNELNYIETIYTPCFTSETEVSYAVVISHNITELKQSQKKVETLAYYDALTSLPTRPLFYELLHRELKTAKRHKTSLAVFILDLDEFKKINKTLGHTAGDELLIDVGKRLQKYLRESDTIARPGGVISLDPANASGHFARIGGDEFTLIIPSIANKKDVTVVARRILNLFEKPFQIAGEEIFISTSIGIALYPNDGENVENLLKNADAALHSAKAEGKNTFQYYSAEMNKNARARIHLENNIRYAIGSNEFMLYYQPLYKTDTAQLVGMEALIRWRNKEMGLMTPEDFIPLAEETGLIIQLGDWVVQTACRQCKMWQDRGYGRLQLGVNLSARQFFDPHLVKKIGSAVTTSGIDPALLELEITETAVMHDTSKAIRIINELRELGVRIALDDFGTGYSSLMHLKIFQINSLKIDRVFLANTDLKGRDAAIISAIVGMCHKLQITAVAEGVETKEQLAFLKSERCHLVQGFYFSPPLQDNKFEELLENSRDVPSLPG